MRAMLEGLREDLGIPANDEDLESGFGYGSTRRFDVVRQMEYLDMLPPGAEPGALTTGEYSARSGLGVHAAADATLRSSRARPGSASAGAAAAAPAGITPRAAASGRKAIGQQQQQAGAGGVGLSSAPLPAPVANPEQHVAPPLDIKALLGLTPSPASRPAVASAAAASAVAQAATSKQQTGEPIAASRSLTVVASTPPAASAGAYATSMPASSALTADPSAVSATSMPADSRRSSAGLSAAGAGATTTIEQSTYQNGGSVGLFGQQLRPAQLEAMGTVRNTAASAPQPQLQPDPLATGTMNSSVIDELTRTYAQTLTLRVQDDAAAASDQSASLEFSLSSTGADGELGSTRRSAGADGRGDARSRRRQNRLDASGGGTLGSPTAVTGVALVKQPPLADSLLRSPPDSKLLSDDERATSASAGKSVKFATRPEVLPFAARSASASGSGSGSLEDPAFARGGGAPTLNGMLASFERRAVSGGGGLERETSRTSASDLEALDSRHSFTIPSGQDTYHTQQQQAQPPGAPASAAAPNLHRRGSRDGSSQQSYPKVSPPPLTKPASPKNVAPKQDEDDTYAEDFDDEDTLK